MSATNDGPYFGDETLDFLEELSLNNNRDWFTAHKPRYESFVRDPALAFVRAMAPRLERLAPSLIAEKLIGLSHFVHRRFAFSGGP